MIASVDQRIPPCWFPSLNKYISLPKLMQRKITRSLQLKLSVIVTIFFFVHDFLSRCEFGFQVQNKS